MNSGERSDWPNRTRGYLFPRVCWLFTIYMDEAVGPRFFQLINKVRNLKTHSGITICTNQSHLPKHGLKSLKMNQRRFEETEPEYPFGTFPLGIIRVLSDCTVQYGSGSLSAMWEDVDAVVSLDFSLFSASSHLICLHSQRHIRFPLALSSQPASEVYGQKLWFVMSGCFSAGLWGLTCRHSCSEAVFCLLGEFPKTTRHNEGSFGIRSSSIRTTWPSKRICQCFNS